MKPIRSLKYLRILQGLSPADMAEAIGIHRATWWRWESGMHRPESGALPKIAKALGVSAEEAFEAVKKSERIYLEEDEDDYIAECESEEK